MYKNHFCPIWKSQGIAYNKAIEELKLTFKVVNNVISDKHVESFIKYEPKPKKVQSQLTKMIVFDIESFNTDRAVPYANCIYRLSENLGRYNRDIIHRELEKCRKDCFVFKGTDNINEVLDHVVQFKGEPRRVNNKTFEYNLYILFILAHKRSGFDSYVVLNYLNGELLLVSSKTDQALYQLKSLMDM